MSSTTLFEMPFSEFQLKNAVSSALQQSLNNPTKFSIESNLEMAVRNCMQENLKNLRLGSQCENCPFPLGIKSGFGAYLVIELNYRIRFRAGINAGVEFRAGAISNINFANINIYNSGLGTPIYENNKQKRMYIVEAVMGTSLFIGTNYGEGLSMDNYSINSHNTMSIPNTYKGVSLGYGKAISWNSVLDKEKIYLEDFQRQGIWNVRLGNIEISTNNDTARFPYFGGGTDYANTGGIIFSFAIADFNIKYSNQTYTGDYNKEGPSEREREKFIKRMEEIEENNFLTKSEKEDRINKEKDSLSEYLEKNPYHTQSNFQKNFNNTIQSLSFKKGNNEISLEFETGSWPQDRIHQGREKNNRKINGIQDLKFDFEKIRSQIKTKVCVKRSF